MENIKPAPPVRRPTVFRLLSSAGRWAIHGTFVVFIVGAALRLSVRDSLDSVAVLFYATPWPVLAVLPLGEMGLSWTRGHRLLATGFLALSIGCMVAWFSQSHFPVRPTSTAGDLRLLFWNAEHPKARLPAVIEKIQSANADLIGVAETESTTPNDQQRWRTAFPGYALHNLKGGLLFLSRYESTVLESGRLGRGGNYHVLKTSSPEKDIRVVLVDFSAAPLRSRRPAFELLQQVLSRYSDESVILMGDFNTPRESVYFDDFRKEMQHAFETAGSGMAETWPVPLPVLTLDHVWTSRHFKIARCDLGWWWVSDHRPVLVELSLP